MKKLSLILIVLVTLAVLIAPVLAQESEGIQGEQIGEVESAPITFGGVDACLILSSVLVIMFGAALYMGFKLVKKLYIGYFSNALPFLLMAIGMLFTMQVLCLFGDLYGEVLADSAFFVHGVQMLQVLAGFYLINALYSIYQTRFATAGFIGGEK